MNAVQWIYVLALACFTPQFGFAQLVATRQAYVKASNTGPRDFFGCSVAISGDTMVVGAYAEDGDSSGMNGNQDSNAGPEAGAVYVFVRSGTNWSQQAYLKASNPRGGALFGYSVAISGDTLVVGAMQEDGRSPGVNGSHSNDGTQNDYGLPAAGAAYVFVRSGINWTEQAYLKSPNPAHDANFGHMVSVSGDTVAVGSLYEDAYVFQRIGTNWSQQARLVDTNANSYFGLSVAVSDDTLVVGGGQEIVVFTRDHTNWIRQTSVTSQEHSFGYSIAISGDTIAAGAAYYPGLMHIFVRNGTNLIEQRLEPTSITEDGVQPVIGDSVALLGNVAVIGTSGLSTADIFVRCGTNWVRRASVSGDEDFGYAVAISGETIVVGARHESSSADWSGAAYVFDVSPSKTPPQLVIEPQANQDYVISFQGNPNVTYQLQRATNVAGPWTTNSTFTTTCYGPVIFRDTNAPTSQAFYRVAHE